MNEHEQRDDNLDAIIQSPSYRVAYKDQDFLAGPKLRPMRMELELLKPEMAFDANNIHSTIVVFGGTRIVTQEEADKKLQRAKSRLADTPDNPRRQRAVDRAKRLAKKSRYYQLARDFAKLVSSACQVQGKCDYVVTTGGGPGIMEAANRGAFDVGAKSIGLNISLPMEQEPNPYITPELCFQFNYFAMRKFHFILRAKALVVFPGGFGTLDELFDALTLRQTHRMQNIPIIMFGRDFWQKVINFQFLADEGTIDDEDLDLFRFAETAEEAWKMIQQFHQH
jgi:uncharacterized protein (TIGR00730 family)